MIRLFWTHFFEFLLVVVAAAQWSCAAWLATSLAGAEFPPALHFAAPLAFYALNRWIVSRPLPPPGLFLSARRAYTGVAFTCVFGFLFLSVGLLLSATGWAALRLLGFEAGGAVSAAFAEFARLAITGGLLAVFWFMGYGYIVGQRRLWMNEIPVPVPDLAEGLRGFRIVQVSDLHLGHYMTGERITRYVEAVNALSPDIIVITGDITDGLDHAPDTFTALGGLRARHGVYAILGNHDVATGTESVIEALRHYTDFAVLNDERAKLDVGDGVLHLVGLMDRGIDWARGVRESPPLARLMSEISPRSEPVVVLSHRPDLFPHAASLGACLVLAGHTHGGQLAIPWGRGRRATLARFMTPYPRGTFRRDGSMLHVNLGLGVTGQPIRISTPREITIATLERAAD